MHQCYARTERKKNKKSRSLQVISVNTLKQNNREKITQNKTFFGSY